MKSSSSHRARKELFQRGIQRGRLTATEIAEALPAGDLSDAERWLLFYSLRAAGVEILDDQGQPLSAPPEPRGGSPAGEGHG